MMKKKWLLAFFAATACIAGAIGLTACGETEHQHAWTEWSVTETPTLTEVGKATRTCNNANCDAEADDKEHVLPALLTSEDYVKSNDSSTCTAAGTATYTYSKDGVEVSFTAESPVAEHDWNEWTLSEDNKPSAEGTGKLTRTCKYADCTADESLTEYPLPVLSLTDYTLTNNTATCTAAGTATYTYSKDGVEVSFTAESPVAEHDWNEWTLSEDNKPSAEGTGKLTRTCKYEDCTADESLTEYPLPVLSPTDYSATDFPATCENTGKITYTYNNDEDEVTISFDVETPALGHDWNAWTLSDENKPTLETEGKVTRTCKHTNCDAAESDKEYVLPVLTTPSTYSITGDTATCIMTGTANYQYQRNGINVSFTAVSVTKNHKKESLVAIGEAEAADCSQAKDGITAGLMCEDCGTILVAQERIHAKHVFNDSAPTVDEDNKTLSKVCTVCNKTVTYGYDNAKEIKITASTNLNSATELSAGVNYISQSSHINTQATYLKYTFEKAGTYTIYWVNLNNSSFCLRPATITGSTTTGFIVTNGSLTNSNIPQGFAIEGFLTGSLTYNMTSTDGNQVSYTAHTGDYVTITKESLKSSTGSYQGTLGLTGLVPVKLTLTVAANTTLGFRNYTNTTDMRYFLIGINKEPEILLEKGTIAENNYAVNGAAVELAVDAETAGTYTFMAKNGKFELYVNGEKYSDGVKNFFGYVDLRERYLTVEVEDGDVIKVVKVAGRATENIFTIKKETIEEPPEMEYNELHTGDQTITLRDVGLAIGAYDGENEEIPATEKFYSFTSVEGGYFNISVAEGVTVNAVIRADRTHYSNIFLAPKKSGVFYVEAGKTVIIAFVGNGSLEFNVNIVSCEKPVIYLNPNEQVEVSFDSFETMIELTVGDSVPEGTYLLTFEVPNSYLRAYIYFSVNEGIVVEDKFDSNAIFDQYVNPDLAEGANNTVGANTRDTQDEDYTRTVILEAGDVIYLATSALTAGNVSITLTPVEE